MYRVVLITNGNTEYCAVPRSIFGREDIAYMLECIHDRVAYDYHVDRFSMAAPAWTVDTDKRQIVVTHHQNEYRVVWDADDGRIPLDHLQQFIKDILFDEYMVVASAQKRVADLEQVLSKLREGVS